MAACAAMIRVRLNATAKPGESPFNSGKHEATPPNQEQEVPMDAHNPPDPLAYLAALPSRRLNAILAYVNAIQIEDAEDVAIFLKWKQPETSDEQIALICGVSRSTLTRNWKRYQAAKPKREDHWPTRQQPTKWRRSPNGGRWPLDHLDGF